MPSRPVPQKTSKKIKRKLPTKAAIFFFVLILLAFTVVPRLKDPEGAAPKDASSFNKNQYSINDPASIWAIVNKGRALSADYIPTDLVVPSVPLRLAATDPEMQISAVAAPALVQMFDDAAKQNIHLMVSSAYRSYVLQKTVYGKTVSTQGQEGADSSSAKPGHSEHQTGLAVDVEPASRKCEVELCFADTPEGKWLAKNSYNYGFIIRYQKDQEKLTGYEYEPWHVRYVGVELAQQIHRSNQTLEQFFGLPAFADYAPSAFQLKAGT
jgi:D-alanyl-D-alanine carboxypeptidase